jgi:hypothetical protein
MHFHARFRRLLGSRGDAFSFEEVFGERYWYPLSAPAAALYAEQNNRTAMVKVSLWFVVCLFVPSWGNLSECLACYYGQAFEVSMSVTRRVVTSSSLFGTRALYSRRRIVLSCSARRRAAPRRCRLRCPRRRGTSRPSAWWSSCRCRRPATWSCSEASSSKCTLLC